MVAGIPFASRILRNSRAEALVPKAQTALLPERDYGPTETMLPHRKRTERKMEVAMPMFALGFKTEPAAHGPHAMVQEIVGDLAAEVLMGESAPLYTKLYEENLIDSGFSCGYEGLKGASVLSASGDSRDPEAVYAAIVQEAARIGREGVDEKLFDRLKRSALGRRMRDLDGFESICYRTCAYHFEGVDYFAFPELFRSVTCEQVADFLNKTVQESRGAMSLIWPNV